MSGSWPKPRRKIGDRIRGVCSPGTIVELLPGEYAVGIIIEWDLCSPCEEDCTGWEPDSDRRQWFPNDEDWEVLTPLQQLAEVAE